MKIKNKAELDNWLFENAQIKGHICTAVKSPLVGTEPNDDPAELFNVAFVNETTQERFDIVYETEPPLIKLGEIWN